MMLISHSRRKKLGCYGDDLLPVIYTCLGHKVGDVLLKVINAVAHLI